MSQPIEFSPLLELPLLLATIVFIVLVVILRRLLGFIIPRTRVRLLPAGVAAPAAMAELLPDAANALAALGFSGPVWLLLDHEPAEVAQFRNQVVYRHDSGEVLALLGPPMNLARPNQLNVQLLSQLNDDRLLVSQQFDVTCELLGGGQVLGRAATEASWTELLAGHQRWCAGHGALRQFGTTPSAQLQLVARFYGNLAGHALERGLLTRNREGHLVPSWGLALRILWRVVTLRKAPQLIRPLSPARLSWFAGLTERINLLAPDRGRQWWLFAFSVALFLGLGALFWNLQFALILLVVVGIHESGHFLAMRAFGYRNLQMLALPLVGGVAIGQEEQHPRAAARAWMSLAGPLPGIVIGWVLVALTWTGWWTDAPVWVNQAAWIFLAVNYLNMLPIPPLDGGHVVQALLPQRFATAQAVFLLLACLIGIAAAWYFELTLLGAVFALNLLQVPGLFRDARVMRHFQQHGAPPAELPRPLRLRQVFEVFDQVAGPSIVAAPRIQSAESMLRSLDLKPMGWLNSTVIGVLLLSSAAVPVAGASWWLWLRTSTAGLDTLTAQLEQHELLFAQSETLSTGDLLRGLGERPADDAQLATEERQFIWTVKD